MKRIHLIAAGACAASFPAAELPEHAGTLAAAGMPLLYVPYVPNRHEAFILANRRILADQMAFLLAGVPRHSRLWAPPDPPAPGQPAAASTGGAARKRSPHSAAGRGRENR